MRSIFVVLFIKFFVLGAAAGTPSYSAKILQGAEYDRLESRLSTLSDEIRLRRENIQKASESFVEAKKLLDLMFVYVLESLHHDNKKPQFSRLTQMLDHEEFRQHVYYPVRVGVFNKDDYWIRFTDRRCVNLNPEEEIETGLFIRSSTPMFENLRFGKRKLILTDSFIDTQGEHIRYKLAHYEFKKRSKIASIVDAFSKASAAMIQHYNCDYVEHTRELEKTYANSLNRYHYLAKVLNKRPKEFTVEKEAETLGEIFSGLMPADEPKAADIETTDTEVPPQK